MKRIILLVLAFYSLCVMAQHTLSGTVVSKSDHAPIEMATVRLFSYQVGDAGMDSTLVQGAQTSYDGMFVLHNISAGDYKLIVSSVGYQDDSRHVEMRNQHLDLPVIQLREQVHHLDEVRVQGKAAEMTVKVPPTPT